MLNKPLVHCVRALSVYSIINSVPAENYMTHHGVFYLVNINFLHLLTGLAKNRKEGKTFGQRKDLWEKNWEMGDSPAGQVRCKQEQRGKELVMWSDTGLKQSG